MSTAVTSATRDVPTSARGTRPVLSVVAVVAFAVLLAVAGCVPGAGSPPTPGPSVGQEVARWDQGSDTALDVDGAPEGTQVIGTEPAWQEWLAGLPEPLAAAMTAEVPQTDFSTHLLVVHGRFVCEEDLRLSSPATHELQIVVTSPQDEVHCAWSPYELTVFRVRLDELGASAAEEVVLREPIVVRRQG